MNYGIVTGNVSGSNDRLNAFFGFFVTQQLDRRLVTPSTSHESTSLIQFTSLKLIQPASSLFLSTRKSKEPTRELRNSTRDSILKFSRIENQVSSRVLRLASDCQLNLCVVLYITFLPSLNLNLSVCARSSVFIVFLFFGHSCLKNKIWFLIQKQVSIPHKQKKGYIYSRMNFVWKSCPCGNFVQS